MTNRTAPSRPRPGAVELRTVPDVTVITGASGWLGSALLNAFVDPGHWSRSGVLKVLVNSDDDARRLEQFRGDSVSVETVFGDVAEPSTLVPLFEDPTATVDVIHTAGVIHPNRFDDFERVNVTGTANVARAARDAGVRRFVHVSSNSPFGVNAAGDRFGQHEPYRPYLEYGRTKMEAELAVLAEVDRGLDAVIVRPPWFYGPHQPDRQTEFFRLVRRGRFPIVGGGDQLRSMTYIDNLVQGVVRAELVATDPGGRWWIADAEPYTIDRIVASVRDALKRAGLEVAPQRVRLPSTVADLAERLDRTLQRTGRYNQKVHVLGEMNKNIAVDITAARTELGYEPEVAIGEGMYNSVVWCQEQGIEL